MSDENLPPRFRELGLPAVHTDDGFWMTRKSIADILLEKNIRTFPNELINIRQWKRYRMLSQKNYLP